MGEEAATWKGDNWWEETEEGETPPERGGEGELRWRPKTDVGWWVAVAGGE